jgi:hypothetical protein
MHNCADDIIAYHNDEVTLPQNERTNMKERRDANRKRVKNGLAEKKKPAPTEFYSQGSYAMKTMVQDSEKHYDIDDGTYFEKTALLGERGGELSALDVRQMVRDAVDDGSFKTKPEVLKNCVRVYYDAGYHVDIPSYRHVVKESFLGRKEEFYELASADWKRSDARDVTAWFEEENNKQSPDEDNGRQLRRMCRLIKKFAQSRPSWQDSIGSGFMITKLVSEKYKPNAEREDEALYETMKAIRDRLKWDLVVKHPVTPNETITNGDDDPKAKFLRGKLSDAIRWLEPASKSDCKRDDALACWDKVFNTEYFSKRSGNGNGGGGGKKAMSAGLFTSSASAAKTPVRKEGGGTYA